jgi:hypothetical protein
MRRPILTVNIPVGRSAKFLPSGLPSKKEGWPGSGLHIAAFKSVYIQSVALSNYAIDVATPIIFGTLQAIDL